MPTPLMENIAGVQPPDGGWEERTYYEVELAFNKNNVIHRAIFYTGFLNGQDGGPGGYNEIWSPSYDSKHTIHDAYYLRVVQKLPMGGD